MAESWTDRQRKRRLHVSQAGGTLTISEDGTSNLSFDGEGRLVGAWFEKRTYRRALDNRMLLKWTESDAPGVRKRRIVDADERRAVIERAYAVADDLAGGLTAGGIDTGTTEADWIDALQPWLARIGGWSWDRLEADAARFGQIYKPVSILPPDQYLALVLQATEGCSYNDCTFCTFYRDRPFRIKQPDEFTQHIEQVRDFLGRGLALRKTLFLADANAVIIPQARLMPLLDLVNHHFPILPAHLDAAAAREWRRSRPWALDGIYAFISAPDALRKSAADFGAMAAQNVRRLYVGLETGHDPLRTFLQKQGTAADVVGAVRAIKAGGLGVGLIVMVGIGGRRFRDAHMADTCALIEQLPLDADDLLYISSFVAGPETPYAQDAQDAGIEPLTDAETEAEERRFKESLRPWAKARGVRISRYNVREFLY